jgi:hypothetical protein
LVIDAIEERDLTVAHGTSIRELLGDTVARRLSGGVVCEREMCPWAISILFW